MGSQKVNRYSNKLRKNRNTTLSMSLINSKPVRDQQTGFIHHPSGFPIEFKRLWFDRTRDLDSDLEHSPIGLMFESAKYFKPGTRLEINIPIRNDTARFRGQVVLVRHCGELYEIGLWLQHRADASRARIVEQICHIETYLRERKYRDGPYSINRDRITEEWITKHAGNVPGL
jgi:hypothetical protein